MFLWKHNFEERQQWWGAMARAEERWQGSRSDCLLWLLEGAGVMAYETRPMGIYLVGPWQWALLPFAFPLSKGPKPIGLGFVGCLQPPAPSRLSLWLAGITNAMVWVYPKKDPGIDTFGVLSSFASLMAMGHCHRALWLIMIGQSKEKDRGFSLYLSRPHRHSCTVLSWP
jgi:hypothetical protein